MKNYQLVKEVVERLGHVRIPDSVTNVGNSQPLNRWLIDQRSKRFKLPIEKTNLLEALPGWNWNPHSDRYEIGFRMLVEFVAEFGHSRVPKDWPREQNVSLHQFVQTARGTYRSGEMTQSRISEFEALSGWSWNLTETVWYRNFEEFESFYRTTNRLPNRDSESPQEVALERWSRRQSEMFKLGRLSQEKINSLDKIQGWQWMNDDNWDEVFQDLEEFINREKRNPSKGVRGERTGLRLDSWYSMQKKNFARLGKTRQTKLESLLLYVPFTQTTQSWPNKIIKVATFLEEHGTLPRHRSEFKEEASLGLWLIRQKSAFHTLSEDKKRALAAIPGFEPLKSDSDIWYENYDQLIAFTKDNDGRLPTRKVNLKLAEWVYRQSAKIHKLPIDKRDKLMAVPSFRRLIGAD